MKKFNVFLQIVIILSALLVALFGLRLFNFAKFAYKAIPPVDITVSNNIQVNVFPVAKEGYLVNPGIGWQADPSPTSSYFPETVLYANRSDISWKNLNPQEDVYDWDLLDKQLARATSDGKQFSFRVFTMSGESYGGNQIPKWVLDKGAVILSSDQPDYSNCVYQEQWGRFVDALLNRYDGNPEIAFIDISGYGNFNEWSWQDQTEWDVMWEKKYKESVADSSTMQKLDSQARRRLADMFIGGSYKSHQCRNLDGNIQIVDYSYNGAKKTQLIMPYAGIVQSTQYVLSRRKDVGFRFDCLGRDDTLPFSEISQIWPSAPIIYEFCGPNSSIKVAKATVDQTHPILIHDNNYHGDLNELLQLVTTIGYRFFLKKATSDAQVNAGEKLPVSMLWQNLGTSPFYYKMGQNLGLYLFLVDQVKNRDVLSVPINIDISKWMPADPFLSSNIPIYKVDAFIPIPTTISGGSYSLLVSIIDNRTGLPIQLAMDGINSSGRFVLFDIKIK
jgi:hypothetical protein